MAVHLLAVLGTGLYEPVFYTYGSDFISSEQEFIQLVLVEKFKEELMQSGSKVTIFLTKGAREKNWENRDYTAWDVSSAGRWASARKENVQVGGVKKGLKTQFAEQFPGLQINEIDIEDAQTNEQIDAVFNAIFNALDDNEDIIFDITHSFRSIPLLAMTVINYAKIMKNCSLHGIYYGAYEAAVPVDGRKIAPINNLTSYNDILEWSNAANVFMKYGNASMIRELFNKKMSTIPKTEMRNWADLRKTIKMVCSLSDAIQTGRGADGALLQQKRNQEEVSVKAAYTKFADSLTESGQNQIKEILPLYHLFEKIKSEFEIFNNKYNYEVGLAVTKWSIDNEMIQQGFTALEESIKTYFCERYGLNEIDKLNRESVVNGMLNILQHLENIDLSDSKARLEVLNGNKCASLRSRIASESTIEEAIPRLRALEMMFSDDNLAAVQIASDVKAGRNDINHFGMRFDAKSSENLRGILVENYELFCKFVKENPVKD